MTTSSSNKEVATAFCKAMFEDFDAEAVKKLVDENYIQHNPHVPTGAAPVIGFVGPLKEANIKLTTHRTIAEGDLVVFHNTYENAQAFGGPTMITFDMFRMVDGKVVEHWDNLQPPAPTPNASGRTMTDGTTEIKDLDKTANNKQLVENFIDTVLIKGDGSEMTKFVSPTTYLQHNPKVADGLDGLGAALEQMAKAGMTMVYTKMHYCVAEGNFVFTASEGTMGETPTAFFDLFRLEDGLIVEHWDTMADIPEKMAHENGKF